MFIQDILLFSHSVMSDSLWPHGLQHSRLPCSLPSYRACSNSCPLNPWCHPTISSSEMKHWPDVGFHLISGASQAVFMAGLWWGWIAGSWAGSWAGRSSLRPPVNLFFLVWSGRDHSPQGTQSMVSWHSGLGDLGKVTQLPHLLVLGSPGQSLLRVQPPRPLLRVLWSRLELVYRERVKL